MGQADPIDEFMALPQDKQVAMLKQLPRQNQDKLLEQVTQRRLSKATPPTRGGQLNEARKNIQSTFDRLTAKEPPGVHGPITRGLSNIGAGVIGLAAPLVHPIQSAEAAAHSLSFGPAPFADPKSIQYQLAQSAMEDPVGTAEQLAGNVAGAEVAGAGIRGELTPRISTSRAPSRTVAPLIKATEKENVGITEANAKESARAAEAQAKQTKARAEEVRKVGEQRSAMRTAEEKRSAAQTRKSGLERGSNQLGDQFQADLRTLRDSEAQKAGDKFNSLNAALDEEPAHTEFLPNALSEAAEKIKGSNTEPTILRDMEQKLNHGEGLTYRDLQGYYSELGRELQKGTLAGDVYHAYSTLQDTIGDEMQRIADSRGLGEQLTDARQSWRSLKQTFYDPKSPLRKALDAKEPGGAVKALAGKDRTGIEALAKYDPKLAQRANTIRGYAEESKATKVPAASTKAKPELPPKPEPIPSPQPAPLKRIGAEDIKAAKRESYDKRVNEINRYGHKMSVILPMLYVAHDLVKFKIPNIPEVAAGAGLGFAGTTALTNLLERPAIVDFFTKATAADLAQIPADLRADMPALVQQATRQGIQVSPALRATFAGGGSIAPRKHPSDIYADGH